MLCYAMLCSDGELSIIISERRWGPRLPERPAHRKSSIGLATAELPKVEAYKPYAMLCYAMLCYAMLCYAMLCYVQMVDGRVRWVLWSYLCNFRAQPSVLELL